MQQADCAHSATGAFASSVNVINNSVPNRRAIMTLGLGLAAVTVSAPSAAIWSTSIKSTSIEAHWMSVKRAYVDIEAAPADEDDGPHWQRIDAASQAIHRNRPTTAREAEICLWCGLLNNGHSDRWIEQAIIREDLTSLSDAADEMRLDYEYLFFVRALEGLRHTQIEGKIA